VSTARGISVLIAQSDDVAREELVSILSAAEDMEVVGAIRNGDAAIALTRKLEPDIVLVDLDLVGKDGIETTEAISTMLPGVGVILLSTDMSAEVLRRAMVAGARQFLQMPPNTEEVLRAVYQVHDTTAARRSLNGRGDGATTAPREGQIIAVFSPKGGVGCTTVATNLAVAIKQEAGMRVALVDGSLTFGDVGVFLDLPPTHSIMDLQVPSEQMDASFVETALVTHERSGIKVLLAPQRPEMADMVTGELLRRTITLLRERHEYVLVDTWSALDERVLTALETADKIVLVLSLELSAIKSAKVFLEVADLLKFPPEKILLVVTRATAARPAYPGGRAHRACGQRGRPDRPLRAPHARRAGDCAAGAARGGRELSRASVHVGGWAARSRSPRSPRGGPAFQDFRARLMRRRWA
jgi:pilus assembly protein CpaE